MRLKSVEGAQLVYRLQHPRKQAAAYATGIGRVELAVFASNRFAVSLYESYALVREGVGRSPRIVERFREQSLEWRPRAAGEERFRSAREERESPRGEP